MSASRIVAASATAPKYGMRACRNDMRQALLFRQGYSRQPLVVTTRRRKCQSRRSRHEVRMMLTRRWRWRVRIYAHELISIISWRDVADKRSRSMKVNYMVNILRAKNTSACHRHLMLADASVTHRRQVTEKQCRQRASNFRNKQPHALMVAMSRELPAMHLSRHDKLAMICAASMLCALSRLTFRHILDGADDDASR